MKRQRIVIDIEYDEKEIDYETVISHTVCDEILVSKIAGYYAYGTDDSIGDNGKVIERYRFEVISEDFFPPGHPKLEQLKENW